MVGTHGCTGEKHPRGECVVMYTMRSYWLQVAEYVLKFVIM